MDLNNSNNSKDMSGWLGLGLGVANSAIGMIGQRKREERANKQTEKLMGMQQKNQMALNEQGRDLSMDMWNKTNVGAQLKHVKDAGLSAGLMYGGSGAGGSTAGSGSGGSAASGSASQPQQMPNMLDVGAIAQMELLKAQKENIEADTANKKEGARGQGYDNDITESGLDFRKRAANMEGETAMEKANSQWRVLFGDHENGKKFSDGTRVNRYEQQELDKLKSQGLDNLMKTAQKELSEATASNLISNDELIQLQTNLMQGQVDFVNGDYFQKLPVELQGLLLMIAKKMGGL